MLRRFLLAFSALLLSFSLFAGSDLEALKKSGVLKVAVDTTYPPMEFEDMKGNIIGFDVDFAKELANRMGVKAEFVVMPWDGILAGLTSKRYDVIISSMNITDDRKKVVNFVEYARMGQIFVAKKGGKVVKSKEDLEGLVVAVQKDTTSSEAVEKFQKEVKIKAVKNFSAATDTFNAIKAGQADVIVIDEPVGNYYVNLDPKTFVVTGEAIAPEPIGIAIRKTDRAVSSLIEESFKAMVQDGTYKKIYQKWFGKDPVLKM
ncbi:MAG: amino acid ABC transporter substrate-binding protein [Bdellovibrio sp.]